jgi:dipeptidyl aminopeptidase/acylaminoacyl peptidase
MGDAVRSKELGSRRSHIGAGIAAGLVVCTVAAAAASGKKGAYTKTVDLFEFAPGRAPMLTAVYEPPAQPGSKPRPLLLALHYGGPVTPETGTEFAELLVLPALKGLGAVILAPNCPGRGWRDPVSEEALLALLAAAKKTRNIDDRRVVVLGFSMGGAGTYWLAARHPELFSAAIPVAGAPGPDDLEAGGRVPLFIIHGENDEVVPVGQAQAAFKALRKGPASVRLDIVPGLTHYQTAAYVPALYKAAGWLKGIWKSR